MEEFEKRKKLLKPKIFIRVRPIEEPETNLIKINEETKEIFIKLKNKSETFWQFNTNGIFLNESQDDVYKSIVDGIIEKYLKK